MPGNSVEYSFSDKHCVNGSALRQKLTRQKYKKLQKVTTNVSIKWPKLNIKAWGQLRYMYLHIMDMLKKFRGFASNFEKNIKKQTFLILQITFKDIVILTLYTRDYVCDFIILTAIYQCILDSLPGILTSQYANL